MLLMTKDITYTIFKTKWGYFGLAVNEKGLIRTVLPCKSPKIVKKHLITGPPRLARSSGDAGLNHPKFDKNLLKSLQKQIIAYFEGRPLSSVFYPLNLSEFTPFVRKTLAACKKIPSGKTVSYSRLAGMLGKPKAGRAVGNALARNPVPLLIPCHRVIRSDGKIGNFSAPGGSALKRKLIALESNRSIYGLFGSAGVSGSAGFAASAASSGPTNLKLSK
jgi:methylated-DNA-[protein]-cysteine S-methyltransferase